jgi:hypothetical protein
MQIRQFIYTLLFGIILGAGLPGLGIWVHYKLTTWEVPNEAKDFWETTTNFNNLKGK